MRSITKIRTARPFTSILICLPLVGCSGYSATGGPGPLVKSPLSSSASKTFEPLTINTVAVLPFEAPAAARLEEPLREELTEALIRALELHTSLEVLNTAQPEESGRALEAVRNIAAAPRNRATELGRRLAAQGVLYGVISRYEESDGTRYGANNPSAVAVKLWLVDPRANETVWTATYENRDQPLSDNLFRVGEALQDGIGFRSSKQLLERGFADAAKALELLRTAAPDEAQAKPAMTP